MRVFGYAANYVRITSIVPPKALAVPPFSPCTKHDPVPGFNTILSVEESVSTHLHRPK